MRFSFRMLAAAALVALCLAAVGCTERVAKVPHSWEFLHVEMEVLPNGDALVTERHGYRMEADALEGKEGSKYLRYRFIPMNHTGGIDRVKVSQNGKRIRYETGIDRGYRAIRWEASTPREAGVAAFDVEYRVVDLVKTQDEIQAFRWVGIFPSRHTDLPESSVRVKFPENVAGHLTNKVTLGTPAEVTLADERTVLAVAEEPVPADGYIAVLVDLRGDLLDLSLPSVPPFPSSLDDERFDWKGNLRWSGRLALILALLLMALLFVNRRRWHKIDYDNGGRVLEFPPTRLAAPLLAVAGARRLGATAMLSAIIDQCQRRLMTVEWSRRGYLLRSHSEPASPWQAALHDAAPDEALPLRDLHRHLAAHAGEVGDVMGREVQQVGFFDENPHLVMRESRRMVWGVLWLFTMVLFATSVAMWVSLVSKDFAVMAGIVAALPVAALAPLRHGYLSPTAFGLEQMRDWLAFRTHIERLRERGDPLPATFLPYAAVFNRVRPDWVSGAGGVPGWFVVADDRSADEIERGYAAFMAAWGLRGVRAPRESESEREDREALATEPVEADMADPESVAPETGPAPAGGGATAD